MAVEVFKRNAPGFKRWLREHPDGYVLNCYTSATGKVHTARCRSYWSAGPRMTSCAKACSTTKQVVRACKVGAYRNYPLRVVHVRQQRIVATRRELCKRVVWAGGFEGFCGRGLDPGYLLNQPGDDAACLPRGRAAGVGT
jgi:hypothetical protein